MVSLDTSSSTTGVAVWINGVLERYFPIDKTNVSQDEEVGDIADKRLDEMCGDIYKTLNGVKPSITVCEMTVVERSAHTQRMLSEIVGTVRGYCLAKKIWFDRLRPTEWRKQIYDNFDVEKPPKKRDDLKKWSIDTVKKLYGINVDDNTADAILIGIAYICLFGDISLFKKGLSYGNGNSCG